MTFEQNSSVPGGHLVFCTSCGRRIMSTSETCPDCGARNLVAAANREEISDKSYAVAVTLCGIFGVFGIHHFYLRNYLHGLFDLALFLAGTFFFVKHRLFGGFASPQSGLRDGDFQVGGLYAVSELHLSNDFYIAMALFGIDALHTALVFYRLIVEKQRDGHGRLVVARPPQR